VFVERSSKVLDGSAVNRERLAQGKLPGNLILTRDAGDHRPKLQPIAERFGLSWGCFVEMPVERGIALALGMAPVAAPRLDTSGFGPAAEEAYAAWAQIASEALDTYQAVYVHLKGPDVPAHDGRAEDKREVISAIDRAFFGEVLGVTGDHSTSSIRMAHTADPVPLLISGGPVSQDGTTTFGERSCATGSLGELLGPKILPEIRDLIGS